MSTVTALATLRATAPVPAVMRRLAILVLWVVATPLVAQGVPGQAPPPALPQPVAGQPPQPMTALPPPPRLPPVQATSGDGRYFGHLPYGESPAELLMPVGQALPVNRTCVMHRDAVPSLYRLMAAAQTAGIPLRAISCFRGIQHQTNLFCGAGMIGECRNPADRARSVAPGGHSEHSTGYVVDFATAGPAGCNDLDPCMSGTPGGLWLMANAPRYGFELSFPPSNKQGVTWEPWHWRWVGVSAEEPGARAARATFARARAQFPGKPAIGDAAPARRIDPNNFIGPRP